jgi:glyoxylase-like metal-dependent hydrolase (beta-lactamase superfamily II)
MCHSLLTRTIAGILAFGGTWLAYTQNQPRHPALKLSNVKESLYEIEGDGGNVAVYVTDEGVILVDDKFEADHAAIVELVKGVTSRPIKYVITTHHHDDHSAGNAGFITTAEIISTINARNNIVEHKQPGVTANMVPARVAFDKECSITLGGKEVRAIFLGRGHTNGDAVVYFPALRTIHTGDLMAGDTPHLNYTVIDYTAGGSIGEWLKTLDEVLKLNFETVIPGHGKVTDKAGLLAYRETLDSLRTRSAALIRGGASQEDVQKMIATEFGWRAGGLNFKYSFPGLMQELR